MKTYGAAWEDNGKNILTNVSDYVVSWPGGATGDAWSLKPGDDYWDEVVDEIWDEYKDTIEKQTGITGLTQEPSAPDQGDHTGDDDYPGKGES